MDLRRVLDARKTYGRYARLRFVMCENQNLAGVIGPKDPLLRSSLKRDFRYLARAVSMWGGIYR